MKLILLGLLSLPLLTGCAAEDFRQVIDISSLSSKIAPLQEDEVSAALKEVLQRGISRAALSASARNGYLGNPRLKLDFPPETKKIDKALRKLKLGDQVDRFIRQLNRSAEQAADRAQPIFVRAIVAMTIRDAFDILEGPKDAATRYLMRTTGDELYAQFRPVVTNSLQQTKATRYYGEVVNRYNAIPLVRKVDPDLAGYATDRSIAGLFLLIAEEEAKIRANPAARTTKLLRRVFGSQD